jgi:uncharacterized membrane protein HdeD (DUF308 family)
MTTISDTMNANTPETTLTHRWGWLLARGVVQMIVGSIAIGVPLRAGSPDGEVARRYTVPTIRVLLTD